jgi:chromate transporter
MSALLIYLLLLKAVASSFAGMGALPQIHQDFVETRRVLSEEQLSQAVLVGRSTPGPIGVYVVAVGYFAGGSPGAIAGWLAMITPALAGIPLFVLVQRWLHLRRVQAAVDAVVIASAILLLSSALQMAGDARRQLAEVFPLALAMSGGSTPEAHSDAIGLGLSWQASEHSSDNEFERRGEGIRSWDSRCTNGSDEGTRLPRSWTTSWTCI